MQVQYARFIEAHQGMLMGIGHAYGGAKAQEVKIVSSIRVPGRPGSR